MHLTNGYGVTIANHAPHQQEKMITEAEKMISKMAKLQQRAFYRRLGGISAYVVAGVVLFGMVWHNGGRDIIRAKAAQEQSKAAVLQAKAAQEQLKAAILQAEAIQAKSMSVILQLKAAEAMDGKTKQ